MNKFTLLFALLLACGNSAPSSAVTPASSESTGTESTSASSETPSDAGKEVFLNVCSGCHGEAAEQLVNLNWTIEKMTKQIREGEGEMPPIGESRLNSEELNQLFGYLRSIKAVAE